MEERIGQILKYINKNGEASTTELCDMFSNVSSMTVRRDLEKLEKMGEIVRTRGGAKSVEYISRLREDKFSVRAAENIDAKKLIAQKTHALIKQDSTIFLDSGTTIKKLAELLTDEKLFIVTAAPNIALECAANQNASVYMTGGFLNNSNLSLSGLNSVSFLDNINIDVAFMAASGFCGSFDCGDYDECQLKKRVISKATKTVMLVDSSKFGHRMPFTFAKLADIDCIVTDDATDQQLMHAAEQYNIEVI